MSASCQRDVIALCDWLFCFAVLFSLAEGRMRFGAKNSAICEWIAPLGAGRIAGITSDFKMDLLNNGTDHNLVVLVFIQLNCVISKWM